jgi:hypothetical protein
MLTLAIAVAACSAGTAPNVPPTGEGDPGEAPPAPVDGSAAVQPAPVTPGNCTPTAVALENFPPDQGGTVTLSGTIEYAGDSTGNILMDLWATHDDGSHRPLYFLVCGGGDTFNAVVPENLGEVHLVAHLDTAGDGPSKEDPSGLTSKPITIAEAAIEGISIVLKNETIDGFYDYSARGEPEDAPAKPVDGRPGEPGQPKPASP